MLTKYTLCNRNVLEIKISKKLMFRLKNTIIDKTLTYASGIWILTKRAALNPYPANVENMVSS
jgi:hypothetical protein